MTIFLLIFISFFAVYCIFPRRYRYVWLLVCSVAFCCAIDPRYAGMIFLSIFVSYAASRLMSRFEKYKGRIMICAVLMEIIPLLSLYYVVNSLPYSGNLSVSESLFHPGITPFMLPFGTAVFTLHAIGYMADVYHGRICVGKNILKGALFISFFPQLMAGPIETAAHMLSQIEDLEKVKIIDIRRLGSGIILTLWGVFMKIMIADRAACIADEVFLHYYRYGTIVLLAGAMCFSLQIYCTFAGYSLIATGIARLSGIELLKNYDTPYLSSSITGFWHRWNISLAAWFETYIVGVLANRSGRSFRIMDRIIMSFMIGLWHGGAVFNSAVWGGLHGVLCFLDEVTAKVRERIVLSFGQKTSVFSYRLFRIMITYITLVFLWVFFRSEGAAAAFEYIIRIFTRPDIWAFFDGSLFKLGIGSRDTYILLGSVAALLCVSIAEYKAGKRIDEMITSQNLPFRLLCMIGTAGAMVYFGAV